MASSHVKVETAQGRCPEHGLVQGTREVPQFKFYGLTSLVVHLFRKRAAKQAPFTCPQCERDLELEE